MQRSGVLPSVRPSVPSIDSSNGGRRFAAERRAGGRYRSSAAGVLMAVVLRYVG